MSDRTCQDTARFYGELCESPRIKVVKQNETDSQVLYHNQTEQFHDELNDGWAKPLTYHNVNKYQLEPLPQFKDPTDSPLELDPSDTPELNESQKIDKGKVQKFLDISPTPQIQGIHSLKEVTKPQTKYPFDVQLPTQDTDIKSLLTIEMKYFKVSDLLPGEQCSGFIQIYDFQTYNPLSEPVYFNFDENSVRLTQTTQRVIYFPIRNLQLDLTLACFIQKKSADSPVYSLYACNYCPLFDKQQNLSEDLKFSQNWYHISNCKDIQSMFTLDDAVPDNLIKVDSKIEVLQIKDMARIREMKFAYSWRGNASLPFSALPLYPLADVPSPVGSIFNLHFILNNPPSNSDLYMKAFAINESGEINIKDVEANAKRLTIFPQVDTSIKDTFITAASPSSNEYTTPECIRVFVNKEITENTLIVLFLMSRQNKKGKVKEEVYKVGVIQLKNEEANLQITQRVPLFDYKGFPKKYLSQPKKMNKTYLQYTIALPPAFFPTPFCRQLLNATDSNVPEFPQDMNIHLSSVFIPIVAKLLSIRSRKVVEKILTLLDAFKNSPLSPTNSSANIPISSTSSKKDKKDKKDKKSDASNLPISSSLSFVYNGGSESDRYSKMLSYWLYTNFDSSTCRPDFFCEVLSEFVDENVLCLSCSRQKYDNAREMVHYIKNGNLDLNTTRFVSNSNLNGDSKPDSKKESKKEKKQNIEIQQKIVDEMKKAMDAIILIKDNADVLLDIVAATVSHYIKQNKKVFKDDFIPRSQPIVKFFKDFGKFLNELDFIETPHSVIIKIAKKYAQVLYMVQTFFTNKELSDIISQIFYDTSVNVDEKGRTNQISLKIQLYVFQSLTYTPNLFVAAASVSKELNLDRPFSPYNKAFGQIFKMADNIFQYNPKEQDTDQLMSLFCGDLSFLTPQLEDGIDDDEVKNHICYFLLPFIIKMPSYYNQLAEVPGLQASIIPFILFVLNNCNPKILYKFYHSLSKFDQTNFVEFLHSLTEVAISTETVGKYKYVKQITQRILNILLVLVDGLNESAKPTVELTNLLLFENDFQTPLNYPNFYNFLSQYMAKQRCNNELISLLIKGISSDVHSLRCLCASLLSWQINADYKRNNDIVQSSISMLDSLTAILLSGSTEEIEVYKDLIELINDLAPRYNDKKFTEMVKKRMKTASVIADVVEDQKSSVQPPEVRCRQTMRVADEYKLLPSMRIQWLQRILTINLEEDNYVSAFVTQMHIVALVAAIYDYKRRIDLKKAGMNLIVQPRNIGKNIPLVDYDGNSNEVDPNTPQILPDPPFHLMIVRPIENAYPKYQYVHSQPYLDFEFLPEAANETQIRFGEFQKGAWGLIQDFDFKMVQKEVDYAFELGMKAELYYSLRPLASLLMRIYYMSRNYEGLSLASDSLQKTMLRVSYESCTLIHDVNLQFYLVEMKDVFGENERQVYCAKLGERSPRADYETQTQVQVQNQSPPSSHASSLTIPIETSHYNKTKDGTVLEFGPEVNEIDRRFIRLIHSKERFGERKLRCCTSHDPDKCFQSDDKVVCCVRLEPKGNIPVDDEDPHCWSTFQTRITRKLLEKTEGDTLKIIEIETRDPLPHYKMTVDIKHFEIVERSKVEVVREIALYSAAVLDVISENLEAYFEYENAETWNISTEESYNYEFVDKLHIVQSVLGMTEKTGNEDDDCSILGLLTALKVKKLHDEAKKIVQEIIQPSLKRAIMIFLRGKKELENSSSMKSYIENVGRTFQVANDFLTNFEAEQLKEDECFMSTTNSVWQKFRFEQDINY